MVKLSNLERLLRQSQYNIPNKKGLSGGMSDAKIKNALMREMNKQGLLGAGIFEDVEGLAKKYVNKGVKRGSKIAKKEVKDILGSGLQKDIEKLTLGEVKQLMGGNIFKELIGSLKRTAQRVGTKKNLKTAKDLTKAGLSIASLVQPELIPLSMGANVLLGSGKKKGGRKPSKKVSERGKMVSQVMKKLNCSLPEASKIVSKMMK